MQKQFEVLMSFTPTGSYNLFPAVDAMTDALLSVNPKTRYLVGGGNEWYDMFKVSLFFFSRR